MRPSSPVHPRRQGGTGKGVLRPASRNGARLAPGERPIDKILPRLKGVRDRSPNQWAALCPAPGHDDHDPSLSVGVAEDGKVLLKCFKGCEPKDIVQALGLTMRDLFPADAEPPGKRDRKRRSRRSPPLRNPARQQTGKARARKHPARPLAGPPITVEVLAQAKGLPAEFLKQLGCRPLGSGGVGIPYRDRNGNEVTRRIRTHLSAKQGSRWPKGARPFPYGLDKLTEARANGRLVLVEGESDAWTLWFHGIPALGIPGATFTKTVQAEYLDGIAAVFVVQEPDEGGTKFVQGVREQLAALGWTGEARVLRMAETGHKDPNAWFQAEPQSFKQAFLAALEAAPPLVEVAAALEEEQMRDALPQWVPHHGRPPEGYLLAEDGVYIKNGRAEIHVSGPVWVEARGRSAYGGDWGSLVGFMDRDGQTKHTTIPERDLHGRDNGIVQHLAGLGLFIAPGKERDLLRYLARFGTDLRYTAAAQLGWYHMPGRTVFVLPSEVIEVPETPGNGERILYQPEANDPVVSALMPRGSLAQWQDNLAALCIGNPVLVFSLCVGLSGPLFFIADEMPRGFHLYGPSSRGKTTGLQAAASVWGCGAEPGVGGVQSYLRSWNTTTNAVEHLAAAHNDLLLCLDEIGTARVKDVGKMIYDLSQGRGKSRSFKGDRLRAPRTWRTTILSTGELSVAQVLAEEKRTERAGQRLRLLDIPVGDDIVRDPHGKTPAEFVGALKNAAGTYYGTAGPELVRRLLEDSKGDFGQLRSKVKRLFEEIHDGQCPVGAPPEQQRGYRAFSVVAAAGVLAAELGILPDDNNVWRQAVIEATADMARAWNTMAETIPDHVRGAEEVRRFIQKHAVRFDGAGEPPEWAGESERPPVRDRVGFVKIGHGGERLWCLFPEQVPEVLKGYDPQSVFREINRQGGLKVNEAGRLQCMVSWNRKKVRVYAVRDSWVWGSQDEAEPSLDPWEEESAPHMRMPPEEPLPF